MKFKNLQYLTIKQLQTMSREHFSHFTTIELNSFRQSSLIFTPSNSFNGSYKGYVFTTGSSGLGYYLDLPLPDGTGTYLYE